MKDNVVPIVLVKEANERPDLCAPCGGKCCKSLPGGLLPEDFGDNLHPDVLKAQVKELLATGSYSLDYWEGSIQGEWGPFYWIRPATKGSEGSPIHGSWGGECTFLTDTGCSLTVNQRPSECRMLIPNSMGCSSPSGWDGKKSLALGWKPYMEMLHAIVEEIRETES